MVEVPAGKLSWSSGFGWHGEDMKVSRLDISLLVESIDELIDNDWRISPFCILRCVGIFAILSGSDATNPTKETSVPSGARPAIGVRLRRW